MHQLHTGWKRFENVWLPHTDAPARARATLLLRPLAHSSAKWLGAQNIHFRQYHVWWPAENGRIYFDWSSSLTELHLYWRKIHVICVKIQQLCRTCANPKQQYANMLGTSGFRICSILIFNWFMHKFHILPHATFHAFHQIVNMPRALPTMCKIWNYFEHRFRPVLLVWMNLNARHHNVCEGWRHTWYAWACPSCLTTIATGPSQATLLDISKLYQNGLISDVIPLEHLKVFSTKHASNRREHTRQHENGPTK